MPKLANLIRLLASSSDPSGVAAGDSYYNTTLKAPKSYDGTNWQGSRMQGYALAHLPANLTPAATTLTALRLVVDSRSMSGWTVTGTNPNDVAFVPPSGLTGLWVAKCGMSWSTSAASSATTERSIQVAGINGSNWTRLAPAHNSGHVVNFEQNLYAESLAFDITAFTSYQLQFYSNTSGNTVSQNQSTGPGAVWNITEYGTWMALEKL